MIIAGLTAALFTILCAGFGVTMWVMRSAVRLNVLECCALSWLLGTGAVSLLLWIGGRLIAGVALDLFVATACLALASSGWRIARRSSARFALPSPRTMMEWILVGIIALEIAAMFLVSSKHALGWDGLLNWEIKARYAFFNDGVLSARYYTGSSQTLSHPEYPLLIPMTQLWLYVCMGVPHQFWVKIIFPIFYAVGVILLALTCARASGRAWAGYLIAALLFFVPYLTRGLGGLRGGYVDFPLSVFYLASVAYLILFVVNDDENWARVSTACLTFLPWVKREGVILWLVVAACAAIAIWKRNKSRGRLYLMLLPGLLIIFVWHFFLIAMGASSSHDFVPLSWSALQANFDRLLPICRAVFTEIVQVDHWSFFWSLLAVAIVYQWIRAHDGPILLLTVAISGPIAVYAGMYVFSTWPDYLVHLARSFPRLLLQVVPVGWLCIALALRPPTARKSLH